MIDTRTVEGGAAHPPTELAGQDREPVLVLLARPARDRTPTAVVWQLLTYDRHTRLPIAEIARRWEPAGLAAGLRPGQDITVPDRIVHWLQAVLDGCATITGPSPDYAGPASWHIQPAAAVAAVRANGAGVQG